MKQLIIDGHCDTMSVLLDNNHDLSNEKYCVNLKDIKCVLPYIQCMAAFVHPDYCVKGGGFTRATKIIDKFYSEYEKHKDDIVIINSQQDVEKVIKENKFGVLLTIENGSAISSDLNNISVFKQRGVRIMSITWNLDNELGCGALTTNDTGLTNLGKQYIRELNNQGIHIDVSHTSEKTFYDVLEITKQPILATHSCAYSLRKHKRNLTDDQIKEIAKLNGTIGICFYKDFLIDKEQATIDDVIDHIIYIASLVGVDHVSLGSDFEGIDKTDLPKDLKNVKDIEILCARMEQRAITPQEIEKILGKNMMRFI